MEAVGPREGRKRLYRFPGNQSTNCTILTPRERRRYRPHTKTERFRLLELFAQFLFSHLRSSKRSRITQVAGGESCGDPA